MLTIFAYTLSGGMLAVLATGRADQIAWRFVRLIGMVVFALLCAVTVWHTRHGGFDGDAVSKTVLALGAASGVAAGVIVFIAPFASRLGRLLTVVSALGGCLGIAAACFSALGDLGVNHQASMAVTVIVVLSQVLGALLLGSITLSWLLGHAYLTATKMTIAPLKHFARMLSWAVAVRLVFFAVSVMIAWLVGGDSTPTIIVQLQRTWLIVFLRVGVGLLAVALFAYMIADCVRRRSTQSATGILYFGSIFAYVGELANHQLLMECGWPL